MLKGGGGATRFGSGHPKTPLNKSFESGAIRRQLPGWPSRNRRLVATVAFGRPPGRHRHWWAHPLARVRRGGPAPGLANFGALFGLDPALVSAWSWLASAVHRMSKVHVGSTPGRPLVCFCFCLGGWLRIGSSPASRGAAWGRSRFDLGSVSDRSGSAPDRFRVGSWADL